MPKHVVDSLNREFGSSYVEDQTPDRESLGLNQLWYRSEDWSFFLSMIPLTVHRRCRNEYLSADGAGNVRE